jgi:branched-chain amino acid transport system substrate-binding protein
MMKKTIKAAIPVLCIALAGCGPRVQVSEWGIPFLNCISGTLAVYGEMFDWGAQRAALEINQAGGIAGKPVKILPVDTSSDDPQKGVVEMAEVVQSSLVALGPVPEPIILAAMPTAVESRMMSFTASTSLEYAEKFFPWSISWFAPTDVLSTLISEWVKQFDDVKSVVQFVEPYAAWQNMAAAHVKGLAGTGIMSLPDIQVPSDAVTFGSLVVKALEGKPDAIIFACSADKIAKIVRELANRGWTKKDHLLIFSSGDTPDLYAAGGAELDGVEIYNYIDPNLDTPRWNVFKEAYMQDHNGELPLSLSTNYYDAVYMIKEAIEKSGITGDPAKLAEERKKISDYCANVKGFKGIMFTWDMTDDVPTNKPVYIFKIQGDKKLLMKEVRP